MSGVDWMPEARQMAAQCWCDPETSHREMDVVLAEAIARRIAGWMDTAAQNQGNADFYRSIVVRIGEMFGPAAKTSDDGALQQDVLALKVPELVERALAIADDSMVCQLCGYGVPMNEPAAYGMADENGHEVKTLAEAGPCLTEACQWLIGRGLATLTKDGDSEIVKYEV